MSPWSVPAENTYVRARCTGLRGRWGHCAWEGLVLRGPLDQCPPCPRCGALTEATGRTPMRAVQGEEGETG